MREIYKIIIYLDKLSMALTTLNSSCRIFGKKANPPLFVISNISNVTKSTINNGTLLTINQNVNITFNKNIVCEVFMCGAGGAGAVLQNYTSGGGGGGGVYYDPSFNVLKGTYNLVKGISNGGNTSFNGVTCNGGNIGQMGSSSSWTAYGGNGGSIITNGSTTGIAINGSNGGSIIYNGGSTSNASSFTFINPQNAITGSTTNIGSITCSGGGKATSVYVGSTTITAQTIGGGGNTAWPTPGTGNSGVLKIFIPNQ
jgi:hypothetical protein